MKLSSHCCGGLRYYLEQAEFLLMSVFWDSVYSFFPLPLFYIKCPKSITLFVFFKSFIKDLNMFYICMNILQVDFYF